MLDIRNRAVALNGHAITWSGQPGVSQFDTAFIRCRCARSGDVSRKHGRHARLNTTAEDPATTRSRRADWDDEAFWSRARLHGQCSRRCRQPHSVLVHRMCSSQGNTNAAGNSCSRLTLRRGRRRRQLFVRRINFAGSRKTTTESPCAFSARAIPAPSCKRLFRYSEGRHAICSSGSHWVLARRLLPRCAPAHRHCPPPADHAVSSKSSPTSCSSSTTRVQMASPLHAG